ncbi:glycosyltransferase [Roseburia hominis]
MVVSTQEQKDELIEKLQEYECHVPNVEVIPAGGIGHLRYPAGKRKPYSLVSVSRLNPQKKVDWIIRSVVKAHEINPSILLDIYGSGKNDYIYFLQNIVCENHAQDYICFKGHMDVTEIYRDYEVFIAASTMETLGLSVMEAIGSGAAVIGLDVKYGNRLFVRPGQNGYLVDYNHVGIDVDENKLIDGMAERIVEIFEDEERLEEFHRVSYEIAKNFSTEIIREKWEKLLN